MRSTAAAEAVMELGRSPSPTETTRNLARLMPELRWNDLDFLEFFAVEPTVGDYAVSHSYDIERGGLRLLFTIWQLESVIQGALFCDKTGSALFTFSAYVRGEARFINDASGRYIDFADAIVAPSRFWYLHAGNPFDQQRFPIGMTIRLVIDPDIKIEFVDYATRT